MSTFKEGNTVAFKEDDHYQVGKYIDFIDGYHRISVRKLRWCRPSPAVVTSVIREVKECIPYPLSEAFIVGESWPIVVRN